MSKKIVVLISGNGSNLQALIDACHRPKQPIKAEIIAVFSNVASAYGLVRAQQAGIADHFVDPSHWPDRQAFDLALRKNIDRYQPDLVVLAGYMRILSTDFVQHFSGRLINIHPSLLPKYPGLHTFRRALANGDKEHGASVHFVTEELDGGPVILQARVPILPQDTETSLQQRVQTVEHKIYPQVVDWFIAGRLQLRNHQVCFN